MRLALFVPFSEQQLATSWGAQGWPLLRNLRAADVTVDMVWPSEGRARLFKDLARYWRTLRNCDVAAAWYGGMAMHLLATAAMLRRRHTRIVWIGFEGPCRTSGIRHALDRIALRHVALIICNTTGQAVAFRAAFPEAREHVCYVPYGGPNALPDGTPSTDGGYVFSGGTNNRDYRTLVAALALADYPAHLAMTRAAANRIVPPSNVHVHADLPFSEFHHLLAAASVVVLPLTDVRVSSGHLVLLHAMELGKPVIVSAFDGVDDYVTDGVDGIVVPPDSPTHLAEAIERLMTEPEQRRRLGIAGQRAMHEDHHWNTYSAKLLAAIGGP